MQYDNIYFVRNEDHERNEPKRRYNKANSIFRMHTAWFVPGSVFKLMPLKDTYVIFIAKPQTERTEMLRKQYVRTRKDSGGMKIRIQSTLARRFFPLYAPNVVAIWSLGLSGGVQFLINSILNMPQRLTQLLVASYAIRISSLSNRSRLSVIFCNVSNRMHTRMSCLFS